MNDAVIPPEPRRDISNPFGNSASSAPAGALAVAEQQRSIAEVQARMIIARSNPRDPIKAVDLILQDCTRPTLAEKALYSYARGGTDITGPSIRLAEAIAQRWGNLSSGFKELSRSNGYSEVVAYAWDLQSGYYDERQFQVRHWVDTRRGGRPATDEREIYELTANAAQRRKRAVLLTVIPGDVVEAAIAQCEETLHANADTSVEAMQRMVDAFAEFEVTKDQIEKRIQRRLDSIRPAQVVLLRKIYASLNDGMSEASDWFEAEGAAQTGGVWGAMEQAHAANPLPPAPAAAGPTRRSTRKAPAKEAAQEQSNPATNGAGTARQGAEQGDPDPQTNIGQTAPARTAGETPVTDQGTSASAGEVTRPANAGAALGASAPEENTPQTSSGAPFAVWLIDGDGVALDDTDEFTDPVAFATAYAEAHDKMFPPERPSFVRANAASLAMAEALNPEGVHNALRPPSPPPPAPKSESDDPRLPLGDQPDMAVVPKAAKPTKAAFVAYNEALKQKLAAATTEAAVSHIGAVNTENINAMPNAYRLAAVEIIEMRRKEMVAPAAPATRLPSTEDLVADIYSLNTSEAVLFWVNTPRIRGILDELQRTDRPGWVRVMSVANSVYIRMLVEACTTQGQCDGLLGDKTANEVLDWLNEHDSKAYDTIVAFAKEHRSTLN